MSDAPRVQLFATQTAEHDHDDGHDDHHAVTPATLENVKFATCTIIKSTNPLPLSPSPLHYLFYLPPRIYHQ